MKSTRLCTAASVAAACVIAVLTAQSAQAQTYKVLHTFKIRTDGAFPAAGVTRDAERNLYGTTFGGGAHKNGTVFKLSNTGKETLLYSFTGGADGGGPESGVVRDAEGNFYGTTSYGGDLSCPSTPVGSGCGVVFKLSTIGKETVLYTFKGGTDGAEPQAGVIRDAEGNLYGTASYGGDLSESECQGSGCGVVFKVSATGKETVLYSFTGGSDGGGPVQGVIRDEKGNIYGTTYVGGYKCQYTGCGVVFRLSKTGKETVLYSFTGGTDGANPWSGVIRDGEGNLYGTTSRGGHLAGCSGSGCGTVFRLSKTNEEIVLYSFKLGTDGGVPQAGVIRDAEGNLYGTTSGGGNQSSGAGVIFKVDKADKETVLYSFTGGTDGAYPTAVIQDANGNLYGTTIFGGDLSCGDPKEGSGCGVVFELTP